MTFSPSPHASVDGARQAAPPSPGAAEEPDEYLATVRARARRRWRLAGVGLVALAALAGAAFVARAALRPFDPTSRGTGRALAEHLGAHVAEVVNGGRPDPDVAVAQVFGRDLDAPVVAPMRALFAAQRAAADAPDPRAIAEVFRATRDVNAAFAALDRPWVLDARPWDGGPLLYAYYAEREDVGEAPGFEPERVVFAWRLDRLNVSKAALGYTHREAGAALVLHDQIEDFLVRDVLPALAEGERVELVDEASRDPKLRWQEDVETRAARMVRESFAGAADRDALVRLGTLLARRRALVRSFRLALAGQGRVLRVPTRLVPEADYAADLLHRVPSADRHAWAEIHGELGARAAQATFETLRARFADDVARHELQHRFDAQRTRGCSSAEPCAALVVPAAVRARVGPSDDAPVRFGTMPARVRDETSAYLAEMAEGMPKMTLLALLPTLLDRDAWGDVYCNTAVVVLDALARDLGLADEGLPLVARGAVQRASVASLAAVLFAKTDADLRAAAARTWQALYGEPLPAATRRTTRQLTPWRRT